MMETQTEYPELVAAKDEAERFIDFLVEQALDHDCDRSDSAADAVGWLRYRMTEAVMAAYRRARTSWQRQNLLAMLDNVILEWDTEAVAFLRRVAHFDDDEDVRLAAESVLGFLRRPHEFGGVGPNEGEFGSDGLDAEWP
jgi:hypothetical protein